MSKRALLIAPPTTTKTSTGGGQRTHLIFRSLCAFFDVDILVIGEDAHVVHAEEFEGAAEIMAFATSPPSDLSFWRYLKPLHSGLVTVLARTFAREHLYRPEQDLGIDFATYDLIVGRYLSPLARSGALEDGKAWTAILDADDMEERDIKSRFNANIPLKPHERLFLSIRLRIVRRIQARLFPRIDHVWLVSPDDRRYIQHPSISVLPNIPFPLDTPSEAGRPESSPENPPAESPAPAGTTLLFVGVSAHRPNADGLKWFLSQCWPEITARSTGTEFRVVGSGDWAGELAEFADRPGLKIVGRVDDLGAEYARADLCICPVFDGAGTKIKVLEALNQGCAVVSTQHSAYGFWQEVVQSGITIADSASDFVAACLRLLENADIRREMSEAGRKAVQKHYSYDAFKRIVQDDLEGLGLAEPAREP